MKQTVEEFMKSVLHRETSFRWEPKWDPTGMFSGIKALTYDGLETQQGKTMAFAYVGIPDNVCGPVPGVVLVHGGGGHAFLPWVKQWVDNGYAAIAMDTTGCFPTRLNAGDLVTFDDYEYGISADFEREGYVSAPGYDGMEKDMLPLEEQWMTHAVAQVICARKVLASMPEVDEKKIGLTGVSWGGIVASLVITYDPEFAYAIPVYGSGYLDKALTKFSQKTLTEGNKKNFRAEDRFSEVKMPVCWLAWDDDNNFSIQSNCLSYLATKNEKSCLSLINGMQHGHYETWRDPHSIAYADWIMGRTEGFIEFETQPEGRNAKARVKLPSDAMAVQAKIFWITEPMTYSEHVKFPELFSTPLTFMDQQWHGRWLSIENGVLEAQLPDDARGYYLQASFMRKGRRLITTSVYVEV